MVPARVGAARELRIALGTWHFRRTNALTHPALTHFPSYSVTPSFQMAISR